MEDTNVPLTLKSIVAVENGAAVFVGNSEKTFVICVSQRSAREISAAAAPRKKGARPTTLDLLSNVVAGLDAKIDRVILVDVAEKVFSARVVLNMRNELGVKIAAVDARPSDALALALRHRRPIFATPALWAKVEDSGRLMSEILRKAPPRTP